MSLNLDKSAWKRVRLGEVIRRSQTQVDPVSTGVERYVAGGHVDSEGVTIERWGQVGDGQMGSTFRYVFKPGQVLFVSARPYLRKVGVPDFSGVVADKTYVLDAIPENGLLQEFLPFLLSSEAFIEYATAEATGSMNPRLLWGPMQRYEFDLPPLEEQRRLAGLLWALERHWRATLAITEAAQDLLYRSRSEFFSDESGAVRAENAFLITIGRQRSPKHETGEHLVPYLRSANVTPSGIDINDVKAMNFSPEEQKKFRLEVGDVLVSEGSASPKAVGMPAVWNGEIASPICFQNTLLRYRPITGVTLPGFVEQWCLWAFESGRFLNAASGTNIFHIGVRGASGMKVRVPRLEEQAEFLSRVSAATELVAAPGKEASTIEAMRRAILTQVCGGRS
ncbi:hypothetical protein ACFO0M_18420 [Micromonospora mangrovi]|uniref:Restriction endonuclease subunit S n=2 Tax=Micromonospora TaxID=1873 RepID=A0AAU8HA29_9ACTN